MKPFKIKPMKEEKNDQIIKWYWQSDDMWISYNQNQCHEIEREYNKGSSTVKIDGQRFIDFKKMQQKIYNDENTEKPVKREIKEMINELWKLTAYGSIHLDNQNISEVLEKTNKSKIDKHQNI